MNQEQPLTHEIPLTKPVDIFYAVDVILRKLGGNNAQYGYIDGKLVISVSQDYSRQTKSGVVLTNRKCYLIGTDASRNDSELKRLSILADSEIKPEDIGALAEQLAA